MKYQTLLVEIKHSIGIVWMNRPELHNVFDETMISELIAAMRTLNDDPAVRAVILAGAEILSVETAGVVSSTGPQPAAAISGERKTAIAFKYGGS